MTEIFFKGLSHVTQDDLKTLSVAETGPELFSLLPQLLNSGIIAIYNRTLLRHDYALPTEELVPTSTPLMSFWVLVLREDGHQQRRSL